MFERFRFWVLTPLRFKVTFWETIAVIVVSDALLIWMFPTVVGKSLAGLIFLMWNLCFVILYNGLKTY